MPISTETQFCLSYNLFLITQCQRQFALTAQWQMEESLQHLLPSNIFKNCTPAIFLSMVLHLPSSCWRFFTCHLPVGNSTPVIFLLTVLHLPSSCWQFYTSHLPVDNSTPAISLLTILHLSSSCWQFYTCDLPVDNSTPAIFLLTILHLPPSCWQFYTSSTVWLHAKPHKTM